MASTSTAASASASASKRKGGASAASAPAAKSKKPSYKFALTLALYYLPGDDAVDPGATSIVRSIQGAVFSGDVWDAKSMVRAPVAAGPPPPPPPLPPPKKNSPLPPPSLSAITPRCALVALAFLASCTFTPCTVALLLRPTAS